MKSQNNFEEFYNLYPSIKRVIFDSLTAEKIYNRQVLPTLTKKTGILCECLLQALLMPVCSYATKLAVWLEALKGH